MDDLLLFGILSRYGMPETDAKIYLNDTLKIHKLKTNEALLREGSPNHQLFFVQEGILRGVRNLLNGERVSCFACAGDFITDHASFEQQSASAFGLFAEVPSVVYSIIYSDLQFLLLNYASTEKIADGLSAFYRNRKAERKNSFIYDTLVDQMRKAKADQPDIFKYCRKKHLVSYFRTDPETFNKAMKKM